MFMVCMFSFGVICLIGCMWILGFSLGFMVIFFKIFFSCWCLGIISCMVGVKLLDLCFRLCFFLDGVSVGSICCSVMGFRLGVGLFLFSGNVNMFLCCFL